ncbi:DUF1433 domain-containing protein [Streptococcus acidominimus]|nr:DUF1433 domain-containing protein [Streptococcus acidominimus]
MKKILALLTIIILFVGGCSMMNNKDDSTSQYSLEEREKIKKEQDRMVKYVHNSYENIKKIEFTSFDKNISTGTWSSNAIINDTIYVTFGIHNIGEDSEISLGQHISQSGGQELVKNENTSSSVNSNNVKIIYFLGGK